ncbi:DUF5675 family protein [Flavicella sp.]|uniref:DUF5675 family protein n=1 Tax=Flavicella sp. TaxID=2957742 RepID=UPI003017091D
MKKNCPEVRMHRYNQDRNQTLSSAVIINPIRQLVYSSVMLERGWRNNENRVSCLPIGIYPLVLEYSPAFKMDLWEIKESGHRSECKFHAANFWKQLNGCVAPGRRPRDLDNDGYLDVTDSKKTLADFHKALSGYTEAVLVITGEPGIN